MADRRLVARVPGSIVDRLPRAKSWVLAPYVGFGARHATLEARLGNVAAHTALAIRGSWLQDLRSGANVSPRQPARALGQSADALLYLGAASELTTLHPLPTRFRDSYVQAIRDRHRLLFATRFQPAKAFPTSHCVSPVENVGGEPGDHDAGPPAGSAPHAAATR